MILISHRGNIVGPKPERENKSDYIQEALSLGYEVEIDVWYVDNKYYLGHDDPKYHVEESFLKQEGLWCHAKNKAALEALLAASIHCFWHQEDFYTLTSNNFIWTYPGNDLGQNSICVMPEKSWSQNLNNCSGICSDYIREWKR